MEIDNNRTAVSQSFSVPLRASPSGLLPLAGGECMPKRHKGGERERRKKNKYACVFTYTVWFFFEDCGPIHSGATCTKYARARGIFKYWCTSMDRKGTHKWPTRHPLTHPPLCPGRSCMCISARLQVGQDPQTMETSLQKAIAQKVSVIFVYCVVFYHIQSYCSIIL